ncbi:Uncharacterised protein [Acinetobacter baumannii]|nr:Uncharacterised protein [Acinetobacter baumannii]
MHSGATSSTLIHSPEAPASVPSSQQSSAPPSSQGQRSARALNSTPANDP